MDAEQLLTAVHRAFAAAGGDRLGWADPHPDRDVAPEEYSRVTDPGRYRVIAVRAAAWVSALGETGLAADVQVVGAGDVAGLWRGDPPHLGSVVRVTRLRPAAAGALPLLLCVGGDDGAGPGREPQHAYLVIGAGDPAVDVDLVPDCGCDACDSGSEDLLEWVDSRVLDVVTGASTRVELPGGGVLRGRGDGWSAQWSPGGGLERGEVEALLAEARAGRSPHPVVHGLPWW